MRELATATPATSIKVIVVAAVTAPKKTSDE